MKYFLTAFGLMLIFEGMPYFAYPERMIEVLREITGLPPSSLRIFGLVSMIAGLVICYFANGSN